MNEKNTTYAVLMFLVVLALFPVFCTRDNGTEKQLESVRVETATARDGVESAQRTVTETSATVDRVQEQLERSTELAKENTERLEHCLQLIREIREINSRNREILEKGEGQRN